MLSLFFAKRKPAFNGSVSGTPRNYKTVATYHLPLKVGYIKKLAHTTKLRFSSSLFEAALFNSQVPAYEIDNSFVETLKSFSPKVQAGKIISEFKQVDDSFCLTAEQLLEEARLLTKKEVELASSNYFEVIRGEIDRNPDKIILLVCATVMQQSDAARLTRGEKFTPQTDPHFRAGHISAFSKQEVYISYTPRHRVKTGEPPKEQKEVLLSDIKKSIEEGQSCTYLAGLDKSLFFGSEVDFDTKINQSKTNLLNVDNFALFPFDPNKDNCSTAMTKILLPGVDPLTFNPLVCLKSLVSLLLKKKAKQLEMDIEGIDYQNEEDKLNQVLNILGISWTLAEVYEREVRMRELNEDELSQGNQESLHNWFSK